MNKYIILLNLLVLNISQSMVKPPSNKSIALGIAAAAVVGGTTYYALKKHKQKAQQKARDKAAEVDKVYDNFFVQAVASSLSLQIAEHLENSGIKSYATQRKEYYWRLASLPWGSVAKKYIINLIFEENCLIEEFLKLTGKTLHEIKILSPMIFLDILRHRFEERIKLLTAGTLQFCDATQREKIDAAIARLGILPGFIDIFINTTHNFTWAAATNISYISINNKIFSNLDFSHIIAHEVQHVLHQDWLMDAWCTELKVNKNYPDFEYRLCKLQEKRAEILGALSHTETIYDNLVIYRDFPIFQWKADTHEAEVKKFAAGKTKGHPPLTETCNNLRQLYRDMGLHIPDAKPVPQRFLSAKALTYCAILSSAATAAILAKLAYNRFSKQAN